MLRATVLALLLLAGPAVADGGLADRINSALARPPKPSRFVGHYVYEADGQRFALTLRQEGRAILGELTLPQGTVPLAGELDADTGQLTGRAAIGDPGGAEPVEFEHYVRFAAELTENGIDLTLHLAQQPARVAFQRVEAEAAGPAIPPPTPVAPYVGEFHAVGADGRPVRLVIEADGADRVRGAIEIGGETGALVGQLADGRLQGVVQIAPAGEGEPREFEHFLRFTAELAGETLNLTLRLQQGEPTIPFRRTTAAAEGPSRPAPAELTDVYDGPVTAERHPEGYFTADLPRGWTVEASAADGAMINPGLRQGEARDAVVLLTWGRLEDGDLDQSPVDVFRKHEADVRQMLAGSGIEITGVRSDPGLVMVDEVPGVVVEWTGTGGGKPLLVWIGLVIKRDWYLGVVGLIAEPRVAEFLPGTKRIFASLKPQPPERNREAEAAIAGHTFSTSETHAGGAFYSWYEFYANGRCQKTLSFSGGDVGSTSETPGTWEVVGNTVYLYLQDGQETAALVLEGGRLTGLRFGNQVYPMH